MGRLTAVAILLAASVICPVPCTAAELTTRLLSLGVRRTDDAVPLLVLAAGSVGTFPTAGHAFGPGRMHSYYPLFVLAVQVPAAAGGEEALLRIIDRLEVSHRVDPRRIYLAGAAAGADLVWRLIANAPDRFAAAVPVGGTGDPDETSGYASVPLWAFHDVHDARVTVDAARGLAGSIWAAGGLLRYTEYRDDDPDPWVAVRREERLLPWLFSQVRE